MAFSVSNSPWIQRVDMARFVVLYAMGGLYLDLDAQVTAPLDKLFFEEHRIARIA